jgi:E3 ubiquitin-protein ligase SHPRH
MIRYAQLMQRQDDGGTGHLLALEMLLEAEKEAKELMREIDAAFSDHEASGVELKTQTTASRDPSPGQHAEDLDQSSLEGDSAGKNTDKGKGKIPERNRDNSITEVPELDGADPAGEEHDVKRRAIHSRLRECQVTFHRIMFLLGNVYHVLGERCASEETAAYEAAEDIRRGLLKREWFRRGPILIFDLAIGQIRRRVPNGLWRS